MPFARKAPFGDLERAILEVLWGPEGDPRAPDHWLTVRDVQSALAQSRGAAYTTIMTVLDRMATKGLVEREKSGRAHGYRAMHSREEMTVQLMSSILGEFSEGERHAALMAFVREVPESDRQALRDALADLEGE
ncbi:MAG TPA: BlaI/MecI/CopY family transcriptional regulator [Marmoricola sp.]|nr:BlaI/MecI/CopY family transcriptional regulator [Nocardioidaceae bacterium]MCO5324547.1 BlaI/MecI/CopY family transcriptional regulator [Nocardioidaceae bacterium]HMY08736.1 BlaI/MecI/CopY family transcriptional regulator [Marmoricola sp.]HRV69544.1 BlaI/MecI/CopY family transcriptional regulator [Marmoricola sp.]